MQFSAQCGSIDSPTKEVSQAMPYSARGVPVSIPMAFLPRKPRVVPPSRNEVVPPGTPHVVPPRTPLDPPIRPTIRPTIRPSVAPELMIAENGKDLKTLKNSSDCSLDGTWNSWNSEENVIQEKADAKQKEPWDANSDMESGLVWEEEAGEEAGSEDDYRISQWSRHLETWEDEKAKKVQELLWSETYCCEDDDHQEDEYESIIEEEENEEMIKRSKEVLDRHRRGRSPVPRSCKPMKSPPRKRRRGKKASRHTKSEYAELDQNKRPAKLPVRKLRYSQFSCKETFQCGRSIASLVQNLLDGTVPLSAPFLRLTVFETTDSKTGAPILRCIDNRRLFALKECAKRSRNHGMMVNVNLFCEDTLTQVQRFMNNSDETDGRGVRLRKQQRR